MSDSPLDINAYIGFIYAVLIFFCIGIVVYYAEPGFPWHSYITLTIGYYISFGILLLVPVDIAQCILNRDIGTDASYEKYKHNIDVLGTAYNTFFTLILIFGTFILAYEEYYNINGYFTVGGKVLDSFIRMMKDAIGMIVVALIVFAILVGQHVVSGSNAVLLAAVVVTNGVYEFFLMFFLAYGLVEFPRTLWARSNNAYSLLVTQMQATQDYKEISDHTISIQQDIGKVKFIRDKIYSSPTSDPTLKHAIEVLEKDCPTEFRSERRAKPDEMKNYLAKKGAQVTLAGLAKLREDLNLSKDKYKMAQAKVLTTEQRAYLLEDIVAATGSGNTTIYWTLTNKVSTEWEYKWYIVIKPILYKLASIMCVILSVFSFLGVVCSMSGVSNDTSVYFLATHTITSRPGGIVVFILVTLGYTTYVSLWAIFQMRISGLVELVPFRTSPEYLSFNTRMCIRLAAPIAFFYLGWIAENGIKSGSWTSYETTNFTIFNNSYFNSTTNVTSWKVSNATMTTRISMNSAFSNFYNLQAIPIVSALYGTGFPIVLFILIPLFALNIFNRVFILLKMPKYQFGTPIPTDEQLNEGRRQLAKFKKIAERSAQRNVLKSYITNITKQTEVGGAQGFTGFFRALFSAPAAAAAKGETDGSEEPALPPLVPPESLNGDCERKMNVSRMAGAAWKEMYAEVAPPGILFFFKDRKTGQSALASAEACDRETGNKDRGNGILQNIALGRFDLVEAMSFSQPAKPGGKKGESDTSQIDIEMAAEVVKIRFSNPKEAERWITLLQKWKDYSQALEERQLQSLTKDLESGNSNSLQSSNKKSSSVRVSDSLKEPLSQFDQNIAELDNIKFIDDEEDKPKQSSGFFSSMFSKSDSKKITGSTRFSTDLKPVENVRSSGFHTEKPDELSGWLEKRNKGKGSTEWQKSDDDGSKIDLRQVVSVEVSNKQGKDDFGRFDIDTGDKVFKFKAKTRAEAEQWANGLNEWKEYFLLKM